MVTTKTYIQVGHHSEIVTSDQGEAGQHTALLSQRVSNKVVFIP